MIPEEVMSGFHLKDIFDKTNNFIELKKKIYDQILDNKRFPKSQEIVMKHGKETKKDESSMINFDLFKFCQDNNSVDCYKALQKEDLHDAEILFKIDMGVVEKALDLKVEGKKVLFMQKLKEMREKFEKEGEIFYMDQGLLETDDDDSDSSSLKLKTAKSHFQFERNEILA